MPVNRSLAKSLKKTYGDKEGESVYHALENSKGKTGKMFKKGMKTAAKEGHTVKTMKAMKPKPKMGKGADAATEGKREAKMSPKRLAEHEKKEKAEMGAKKYAAHEAAEKRAMKKTPAKKK